jgi:GGDEF domain-containing protein
MSPPEIPDDEAARLAALRGLGLLDTAAEERFDRITRDGPAHARVPTDELVRRADLSMYQAKRADRAGRSA